MSSFNERSLPESFQKHLQQALATMTHLFLSSERTSKLEQMMEEGIVKNINDHSFEELDKMVKKYKPRKPMQGSTKLMFQEQDKEEGGMFSIEIKRLSEEETEAMIAEARSDNVMSLHDNVDEYRRSKSDGSEDFVS